GVIEQVGSPLDLYHKPQNKFVAGFIGSPKMNLIEGAEAAKHDAHTIGIRPEHVEVSTTDGLWQGTVGVAEHLGSDTFIHIHGVPGCDPMTVRAAGDVAVKHGDTVYLTPNDSLLHKFDDKGLRIE
ncbi:MAG: TOBE domain-containing protein, partial [Pseudomonadota bacterium]